MSIRKKDLLEIEELERKKNALEKEFKEKEDYYSKSLDEIEKLHNETKLPNVGAALVGLLENHIIYLTNEQIYAKRFENETNILRDLLGESLDLYNNRSLSRKGRCNRIREAHEGIEDTEYLIIDLERFLRKNKRIRSNLIIGFEGEEKVNKMLKSRPDYKLVENVVTDVDGELSQHDSIIVCKKGIFTIEVKNYQGGDVVISREGNYMQEDLRSTDPISQCVKHENNLSMFLSQKGVITKVVAPLIFANNNVKISNQSLYPVFHLSMLTSFIDNQPDSLTDEQVDKIYNILLEAKETSKDYEYNYFDVEGFNQDIQQNYMDIINEFNEKVMNLCNKTIETREKSDFTIDERNKYEREIFDLEHKIEYLRKTKDIPIHRRISYVIFKVIKWAFIAFIIWFILHVIIELIRF